jgi:hypothetical protein
LTYCINCGAEVSGKYCHECGQKANIKRLDTKTLLEEVGHFFTHVEKNFLQTTKEYIIRPGAVSINYLKGKRKHYQKPVSFFLIWTGLYILLHNFIINYFHYRLSSSAILLLSQEERANELLRSHFTLFFLPALFLSSVAIYLILARPRFFYPEVLALSLYGAGCYNAMLIIIDIVAGAVLHININNTSIFIFLGIISAVYDFWFCYDLFRKIHIRHFWLRLWLTAITTTLIGWVILVYLPELWLRLFH